MNIRHRATEISELVVNPHRLEEERQKAAENKAKYTGVSADQMRSGATGFGSTSRSGGFHSSSLTRPGESSAPRAQSFRTQSSASFSLGGQESVGVSSSMKTNVQASTRPEEEVSPVRATQARIARMALSSPATEDSSTKKTPKKKLSDVRANPKIAASLGLKVPAAAPTEKPTVEDDPVDLLSTLDVPSTTSGEEVKGVESAAHQPSWDPFGGDGNNVPISTAPEKKQETAPLPEDIFASLSTDIPQNHDDIFAQQPKTKEPQSDVFDPFNTGVARQDVKATAAVSSDTKDPFADLLA